MRRNPPSAIHPEPFAVWLLQQAGLDPAAYRAIAVQRRVAACFRLLRVDSGKAARELLERQPHLVPRTLNVLLIGVTEFFRDRAVFEHLRRVSIPELLAGRGRLRVYSAGVSDGQELCSMAMLLAEAGALAGSYLLGADCRPEAIHRARSGCYSAGAVSTLELDWRERWFEREGGMFVLRPEISRHLHWSVENVLTYRSINEWDVILFRNVAIYLEPAQSVLIWETIVSRLSVGGLLVTGKAERPPGQLPMTRIAPCIFRKEAA
ncbi:MAG TPA: CheR family methyltransferase [Verrucomicrobiae bacterium]|nr:CheR family methyltransferase [Verrucomicrobiae bacterium]